MNEVLINFVLPICTALIAWFGNAYRNKQKKEHDILDNVQQILDMQNQYIERQSKTLDIITAKNDRKRESIKRAYQCKIPSEECPVLQHDAHVVEDTRCDTCAYKK